LRRLVKSGIIKSTTIITDKGEIAVYYANDKQKPEYGKTIKERVYEAIKAKGEISIVDAAKTLGASFTSVSYALKVLFEEGTINRKKVGVGKTSRRLVYFTTFF